MVIRIMGYFLSTGQNRLLLAAPLRRACPCRGGCKLPAYPRVRQLRLIMPTTLPQGVLPEPPRSSGGSPAAICMGSASTDELGGQELPEVAQPGPGACWILYGLSRV